MLLFYLKMHQIRGKRGRGREFKREGKGRGVKGTLGEGKGRLTDVQTDDL